MKNQLLYVSEEHIGAEATPSEARKVVDLLQAEGWVVVYGDRPWQFEDATVRDRFQQTFQWAITVVEAERTGADATKMAELARQRVRLNSQLQSHEATLIVERPWKGYWQWLIRTPTEVILSWLKISEEQDAPGQ